MAVDPFTRGIVMALTGMEPPDGDPAGVAAIEAVHRELGERLGEFQEMINQVTQSVSGAVTGKFSDAYIDAMSSFASKDSVDFVKNLRDTASQLADYSHEFSYQMLYTQRMIIAQVVMFVLEWAITLILAIFNPIEALAEQGFLRSMFRAIMRSFLLRLLATIATHEALNIGLGASMDAFVRWSLSNDGHHTANGNLYRDQAIGFGAVQGAFAGLVPFGAGGLNKLFKKGLGIGPVKDIKNIVDKEAGGLGKVPGEGPQAGGGPVGPKIGGGLGGDLGGHAFNTANLIKSGGLDDAARDAFRTDVGHLFSRDLGGIMDSGLAGRMGHDWADTFMANFGKRGFGTRWTSR